MLVIPAKAGIHGRCLSGKKAMERQSCVYLLASDRNGTLYLGVTSDLVGRIWQHRQHAIDGFSSRYSVTRLVWLEQHESMEAAIGREKQIKKWNRAWKLQLIDAMNPSWRDLWPDITGQAPMAMSMDCSLRSSLRDRPAVVQRAARLSRLRGNDEQKR